MPPLAIGCRLKFSKSPSLAHTENKLELAIRSILKNSKNLISWGRLDHALY